ncbi:dihydropyrimidine dehydrogenase subunit A [Tateyamaria omphalii]|uniref:NAD(P)-dependent oxidoreductase n=1 Tax=Tateyamaria omphalii TaxID=299262 RepID=UPI001677ED23|nr:NAD(P)-dependent oxidoreductase [Tateyamaria omphalii]GGX38882.1 dihydropyrimidine dehydrogenase subunit A [Tateyamaria omphalii]
MAEQPMLKFVKIERDMPEKREAGVRREDFHEIYAEYADAKAKEQASRCSQCGVPYCQSHCPLHNNIPDWLKLTAEGRLREAYEVSQATNTFPEICGRICPQDRLCEGNCVIEQSGHGTVTIGSVEKYITDTAWEEGWVMPITPKTERAESVGIIGAGPGGLAAADVLRRAGVQVTVYDRYDRAGGLLTYGIPGFKLEKDVVMRRNEQLEAGGVNFVLNCDVDADIFTSIRAEHDAVIIATGVYKSRDLSMPNGEAEGIEKAIDFLTASNRKSFGDEVADFDSGRLNAEGKRVVVIGGGDTAMDCVRTSIRQGATSVKCLYRRDRANMPGSQREVQNAEEEGVVFEWLSAPKGFTTEGDKVAGVMVQKMRLGAPDATGRQAPEVIEGADYVEEADLVIKALGFEPEDLPTLWDTDGLEVNRWGTIKAEYTTGKTALEGVYAVGDIVRGASLVVWAIRDGRDCADAILEQFNATTQVIAAE